MVVLTACTSVDDTDPPGDVERTGVAVGEETELSVLTYNIEYSGDRSTDAVIEDIDADVVGVLESYNRLPEIAERTGYPTTTSGSSCCRSTPSTNPRVPTASTALIEVQPGYVVAMFNTHLDYVRYGPRLYLGGMPLADVLASEDEVRTRSIEVLTPSMQALLEEGYPVILTGDLNQPSSLDYTEETVGMRKGVTEAIPWPVSETLLDIGMRDTFREIHPDPVENPGLTHGNPDFKEGGFGDRIDYLYAGGPAVTQTSELVGEVGGPNVDREYEPWTSDHRAVLSTFEVTPVELRQTLSLDRRLLTEGEQLGVRYHAPGSSGNTISIMREGGSVGRGARVGEGHRRVGHHLDRHGVPRPDGLRHRPGGRRRHRARAQLLLVAFGAGGRDAVDRQPDVRRRRADRGDVGRRAREPVGLDRGVRGWRGRPPAGRLPAVGLHRRTRRGRAPPTVFGAMTMGPDSQGRPWPLPPGDYRIHYLLADQYDSAGQVAVTVE